MGLGDGTVRVSTAVIPGIKWGDDYNKKSVAGAKPMVFAELCSQANQRDRVVDQGKVLKDNTYMGLKCHCDENQ